MKAMVLAAGLGTRLRPVTWSMPKPMVPVVNRPVMEHIVRLLAAHDFDEIVANLHWFPDTIESHFGDGSGFGVSITYSHEQALLGTAGGVREAADLLGDSFLVISGDALTDIDLTAMREFHRSHDGIATLATRRVGDTSGFGVVITDRDGRIQGFQEKPDPAEALSDPEPGVFAKVGRQQMAGATLKRDAARLVVEGRTTIDEAMRVSAQVDE